MELKDLHNLFHDLESAINPIEKYTRMNRNQKPLDIDYIKELWKKAVSSITSLKEFLERMKYLSPISYGLIDILGLQEHFQASLNESSSINGPTNKADKVICEIASDLLETCHAQMFRIDRELKDQVHYLDKIYYSITGGTDDDSITTSHNS